MNVIGMHTTTTTIKEKIQLYLLQLLSKTLGKTVDTIDITAGFFDLGMDSKMTMELVATLEEKVGHELYPTLLFEYQSIEELSQYLTENDSNSFVSEAVNIDSNIEHIEKGEKTKTAVKDVTIELIQEFLQELAAQTLEKSITEIDITAGFFDLGMDSKMTMQLVADLEEKVEHELYPTLLFEYQSIEELSQYLFENDKEAFSSKETRVSEKITYKQPVQDNELNQQENVFEEIENDDFEEDIWEETMVDEVRNNISQTEVKKELIAIVGVSGRYPKANTIAEFWKNLKEGKDCVSEMPQNRWNKNSRYPKELLTGKWGGFIEDVDKFDPLHFKIAPAEAEFIDPQVRLFLEESWNVIEDAGYRLATDEDKNVGVFVGSMFNSYPSAAADKKTTDKLSFNTGWTIANRVSYHLGLTGPSMHINTACSSSLTAIIEACQSIQNGLCSAAIAGGVNLSLDALKWEHLQEFGLLGSSKESRSFTQGDGYLPGEGVGAILLKPLSKAEQDGDQIYGIIRGGSLNHNGAGNGFTVPNPKAQAALIKEAIEKSEVNLNDISYVEAAANGSAMGDSIEITALSHLFSTDKKPVALGSVKAQIGHLESASGISQVTKVLLQLKNKTLVPGIGKQPLNPNLGLKRTSLEINDTLKPWDDKGNPRMAMINNFGAGGANANIIIQEYTKTNKYLSKDSAIILLSAKTETALKKQATNLYLYLENHKNSKLHDIAYTLQLGREAMEERLALIVSTVEELKYRLEVYLQGQKDAVLLSNVSKGKTDFVLRGKAGKAYVNVAIKEKELDSLIQLWLKGVDLDWSLLYDEFNKPTKVSLPTYPFEKESYWIPEIGSKKGYETVKLHPLVHTNTSDFYAQKFESTFTEEEVFLRKNQFSKTNIFSEISSIEFIREAGKRSLGLDITGLQNLSWLKNIQVTNSLHQLGIRLFENEAKINYEIHALNSEKTVYLTGELNTGIVDKPIILNIELLERELSNYKDKNDCNTLLQNIGINGANCIDYVKSNDSEALIKITHNKENSYINYLEILDKVFCTGIEVVSGNMSFVTEPSAIKEVLFYGDMTLTNWCYVSKCKEENKITYDIDFLSEKGMVLLSLKGVKVHKVAIVNPDATLHTFKTLWKEQLIREIEVKEAQKEVVVLVGNDLALVNQFNDNGREVIYVNELSTVGYYQFIQEVIQAKLKEKVHTSITIVYDTKVHHNYAFISGLLKTASIESPKISGKTIGINSSKITSDQLQEILRKEKRDVSVEVIYEGGIRKVKRIIPVNNAVEARNIKENGVYLITGGAGGLGYIFAKHIAKTKGTKIVLTGRSKQCKLSSEELKTLNASYYTCDITNYEEVSKLVQALVQDYGKLNGVIHAAGVLKDNFLIQKTTTEAVQVLNPKIIGTQNLDEATKELSLDFMVYFASLSGVLGNAGQADYSSANSWMDNYALYRNRLKEEGKRFGHTLSIDWPLWKNGGMQIDDASKVLLDEKYGIKPLPTGEGIKAFEIFLSNKIEQGVVVYGNTSKITKKLAVAEEEITKEIVTQTKAAKLSTEELKQKVEKDIIDLIAATLKIESSRLDRDTNFSNYGVESAMITSFTKALNELYKGIEVSSTIFVTNPTINELVTFLIEEYSDVIQQQTITAEIKRFNTVNDVKFIPQINKNNRFIKSEKEVLKTIENNIAITGISGRFSTADSEEDLWKKSILGTSLEINQDLQYSSLTVKERTTGWSELNISVEEASQMSIQEQLIFDELAKMIEHYSIDKKTLSTKKTGVFIAAQEIYGSKNEIKEGHHTLAYLIPNKISYYLNLKGPSEIVNSYCTSAYVAIHKAIQSIQSGECEQAIIGGVNLVSPEEMVKAMASDFNSLFSKSGKTESFSDTAEGFVRSEGVAVMLIKPLQDAEKEKNTVLGVIKGSAVYHGGKGFSIEAPNSKGIKSAIETSVLKSNIPVNTIDYIEAHGIANKMADAIELGAINSVYTKHSEDKDKKWHVSTSKPTIGHSELVSGMASLIKVLKAFEHKTIPGISGLDSVNSELAPNHSFILTKESCAWKNGLHPRRASLNSFAVGGVNAHLILEEYTQESVDTPKGGIIQEVTELKIKEVPEKDVDTTSIKAIIKNISQEVFQINKEEFDENLSPIDYDFDSIKVIEFVNRINEHFKINVKMGQILGADDFKSMFDVFENVVKEETKDNEINEFSVTKNVPINYSLSEGQKGLWFIQKKEPETTIYNIPIVFKAANILSNDSIYKSFKFLIQKYPILNVTFSINEDTGELLQTVQSEQNIQYTVQQLKLGETIESTIKKLQHVPFNLTQEVSRLHVIEHEELQEKTIVFILHHIVFDGSSITPFIADFKSLLSQIQIDDEFFSADYEVDTTFFDYIKEEENYLKSKEADEDFNFWKNQLKGSIDKLQLPYDDTNELVTENKTGVVSFNLNGSQLSDLKLVAKSMKVNLSTLMLSAFKVLLYKLTGADDIIIKMPTTGRLSEKYKNSVGYYINMILSTEFISEELPFSDLVGALRGEFINSMDHVRYPYPKLLGALESTKGHGEALFPVLFVYQNIFNDILKQESNSQVVFEGAYRQDLVDEYALEILDLKEDLIVQIRYKEVLFTSESVNKHLRYYQKIINSILENTEITINEIDILTEAEKQELLVGFNATDINYPDKVCIHELFVNQAKLTPNNKALTIDNQSITYKELEERSKQLGILLQKKGVVPNTFVGICMDRSIEMIVAIFGILRAGGTYVPIDPDYPTDRITYMIQDSIVEGNTDVKVILTQKHLEELITEFTQEYDIDVISLETDWRENKAIINEEGKLASLVVSTDVAYVIYTSGSTGNPKGVLVKHCNVVSLLKNKKTHFDFNENDVWTMFHSYCFDFSVWEMYGALLFGGELIMVPKNIAKSPEDFASLLFSKGVTVLNQTPGAFYLLQEAYTKLFDTTKIRYVIFGGEALSPSRLKPWFEKYLESQLINMYGITETTVHVTYKRIAEEEIRVGASNIGIALPTLKCYILNPAQQVVPVGVIGELYVGGAGVSKGYLNREDLTKDRFIPNPFDTTGESILYRTGDLAKWLPDGNMEYLGRIDHQVKIRGFRIELGEIEQRLLNKESVKEAVVLTKDTEGGEKELVAYIVFNNTEDTTTELRDYLGEVLPAYMIPAHYVKLDYIPLTRNGKVDRKVLNSKGGGELSTGVDYVAPKTDLEKEIAIVWQNHLNIEKIGLNEDYFHLGGDSIKMIRLLSDIEKHFNTECSINDFYMNPTVHGMSLLILKDSNKENSENTSKAEINSYLESIESSVIKQHPYSNNIVNVFPMSSIQMGMIFTGQLMHEKGEYGVYHDQIVMQIEMVDIKILTKALELMVNKHETLRTSCHLIGYDLPVQIIHKKVPVAIGYEDVREIKEYEKENHIKSFLENERVNNPFDVSLAPAWRVNLFQISDLEAIFIFQIHHAFIDGWGEKNFRVELFDIYKELEKNEAYVPQQLKCSIRDSVVSDLTELKNEENRLYWKQKISEYKKLEIFEDDSMVDNEVIKILDETLCNDVLKKCKAEGIIPKNLFFASYLYIMGLLSTEKDITAGLVTHKRPMVEDGDKLLGCFLNSVPFRFNIGNSNQYTWAEYVKLIDSELQSLRGKDRFPLSEISVLANEKSSTNPFFDVLFNYVDFHILNKLYDESEYDSIQLDYQSKSFSIQNFDRTNTYLNFTVNSTGNKISLLLKQKRALKSGHMLADLIVYFENLLKSYAYKTSNFVSSLTVIPEVEKQNLLVEFNKTKVDHTNLDYVHNLISIQAKTKPNKIAIDYKGHSITYKELEERSEHLAIYLQELGVKPDTLVGVYMERSVETVIAMLAILKAGGAYVPIDTEYPKERILYIIEDAVIKGNSDVNIILTQNKVESELKKSTEHLNINVISLSNDWEQNKKLLKITTVLKEKSSVTNLAYVIYTSGSTGNPKGVLIEHRSFIDLIQYQKNYFEINESDKFIQFSNFSFDASVEQIFLPLVSGATLHIVPKDELLNIDNFTSLLVEKEITHLHAVPLFLRELPYIPNTHLKRIISGGDVFDQNVLNTWGGKGIRIIDKYGPTETTVSAVQRELEFPLKGKHIGRPLGNTYCYVVDGNNQLQPIGVPGELCIGGAGLARGYLNREELTHEKFIDNPFGEGKIYKTGDLVRWLPSGNIDFLGRIDFQVKIRGFRIELGEVEHAVNSFKAVKKSVVIAKDYLGSKQLVAYCEVYEEEFKIQEIKEYLSEKLPEYMVPKFIINIDKIPLTSSGKANRKQLQNKDLDIVGEEEFVAPQTHTEKRLAIIWQELLNSKLVGVYDNFFELGGHSLLITRLLSKLNQEFSVEIPISKVFEFPTLKALAGIIDGSQKQITTSIEVVKNRENQPLSFAQQRLWFLSELGQGDQYHIPYILRVKGSLNISVLEKSLNTLIQRHEILRTTFRKNENGDAYQFIEKEVSLKIKKENYTDIELQEETIKNRCTSFITEPFDLSKDLLIRALVIKVSEADYIFSLCIHHIVFDGWSMNVFMQELKKLYEAYLNEEKITLPNLPIQYLDYAVWQQMQTENPLVREKIEHWKNHLEDYKDLAIVTDYPRPKIVSGKGKRITRTLSSSTKTKLQSYSNQLGGTLFTGLLSSVYILLNKYSGQNDICLGVPVANRNHKEIEELLGFFVNTVVNRIQTEDNDSLEAIFTKVQKELLRSQEYQDIPFDKVVEVVQPNRETSITPIFQVIVNYLKAEENFSLGTAEVAIEGFEYNKAKFDLNFDFVDIGNDNLVLSLVYNTDIFSDVTAANMLKYLQYILDNFMLNSNELLKNYSILTPEDEYELLAEVNSKTVNYSEKSSITELFSIQAGKTPKAIALAFENEYLTYEELESRSNQLAGYLQKIGISNETLVGICMDKSIEMMVSILAILKAGGAYVPIDASYPKERIEYIIEDSIVNGNKESLKLIIVNESVELKMSDFVKEEVQTLTIFKEWKNNEEIVKNTAKVISAPTANNLAYVIYTSGSTGKPKGVMVEHKSVIRLVKNAGYYNFDEGTTILATGAISFDATIFEFFGPLLNGGKLVLTNQDTLLNNQLLLNAIEQNKVDVMWFTSSWLNQIVDSDIEVFKSLKTILAGGERLSPKHIKKLRSNYPEIEIINGYGPTENTTFSITHNIKEVTGDIPLGLPISNDRVYIVSNHLKLQPKGVLGELCVGGNGVARGYLNQQELTSEKFIDNPFGEGKIYRTGDLARWTNEGVIEFFGRIDHQVKIRGFRIELEEIEQVLNEYTNIEESAVIVKEHLATKQLVAYCVLKNETIETIKELKSYLSEKLPEYMVPKFILKINELPLTPNGKLDRKLLVSKPLEVTSEEEFVKPRTETEKKLAIIWKELLTVETVGVYDNFFELGGHSLLITRLVSKVNKEMDVVLPISKVFEHPTLETMAENVDKSQKQAFTSIKVVKNREYQSLSFAQQRLWFLSELGQGDQYHIPYLIRIKGNLEVDILEESLNYLIERHEILRTKFHKNNKGKAFQYIENRATINITQEDYSEFPLKIKEESIKRFCENFIYKSFDLSKDLLVRALVIKVSKEEYVFGLCIHHIIFDGWSLDIFMRELKAVYEQSISKKEINLPSLPIQYLDYSVWQQAQAENELFIEKIEHWKNHLENYNDLSLPTDYPRPKISTGRGKRIVKAIDSSVKVQLTTLTTKSGGTLFSGLLSSVYILLAKYSGQKDICLGIPVANRTHKEAEGLIGFFVNTIVSRLQFKEEDSLLDILKKTHKELIRGQEYQEIPFDKVVEAVQPTRETSITPIFQVMVNYLKMEEKINFGSTVATIEELAYDKVKFDLSIDFIDTEDKGLMVSLGYSTDLYSDATAERLLENLHNVLKALAFDSTEIFKEHSFVTAQETTQLLTEFNATQFDYSITGKSIQAEFEQQVKIQPNAIALTFGDISITYKELANRSKQLAIYLQNQGVEPDTLVGIFMERSIEAIVSMLGVLMSGGAYVPIDPDYPESRINFIIDDAIIEGNKAKGVHLILTQQDLAPRLKDIIEDTKVTVISIQSDWKSNNTITKEKGKLTQKDVLTKLAYVIYTSGSTGNPKGVLIEHTNVINLIKYQTAFFKVTSEDQILLFSSFSFDASIEQIYLALLNGGTLHLVSKTTLLDMDQLKNVLVDKKITHLHAVPTFLREIPFIENTSLKRIISGGDVFDSQISDNWGNKGIILIDEYGPTETTVTSIQRTIELPLKEKHIGKPLGNTYCYVVDETNKIQPIGIPGELWIGGKGVSRGYLNRSELTKEKFIENPFGEGRVYKTGDLVRRLPNGNIDFLGRIDQQVKIRGFRIELEEIETVINTHDFIKNNVVLAVDHLGTKQLVTYFEFNEDTEVNIQELRESLHQKLPEYMVPKFIIPIDKIPLTPNGKVNRKFLQTKPIEISREEKYVAPTTKTEKILEGIWKNLLGVNEISIYDNFFELGGHSLLLIQLIQQIKEVVGKSNIQLVDLISSPTIKQQASIIEVSQGVELSNHLVTFSSHSKENTRSVVTFIIPGMPGIVDGYYELAELFSKNNETVYGIQMQGVFAGEEPFTSIEEMALHNIKNIKKTGAKEIRLVAHSYGGTVVFEMLKQLQKESLKISEVLFLDSHAPTKSLKVIEKYKGLLGAILSMIKVKPSEKSLLEFSGKIKQQPKAKRKDFVYNFIISLGGEINRDFYERIFAVYLNSIEASYELKEPVTGRLKLVKASQALVKNTKKALGWAPYFNSVDEVESSGTHFELVKKPFTNIWKNKLDTLTK